MLRLSLLPLMLLPLMLAACATTTDGDGSPTTARESTFRGRWWDYYERGREHLDNGRHAEAEADLRVALKSRGQDQRWARTYGLHFIPEYFPNRELGITLFHLGRLEEAEALLETSISQEETALAVHYLNEVRAAIIERQGGDATPPEISPMGQVNTTAFDAAVQASVRDDGYVARVWVNGEPYLLDDSARHVEVNTPVTLSPGMREVVIEAMDISGNIGKASVPVSADFDGPSVSVDAADDGGVSGTAFDPAGIESVTVDGEAAALEIDASGVVRFRLDTTGTSFEAVDKLGNRTVGEAAGAPRRAVASVMTDQRWDIRPLAQQAGAPLAVRLVNLADGQRYLMDEIVVTVEATAPQPIEALTLDGVDLPVTPGVASQTISRRIRLDGMGEHTVSASVTAGGQTNSASATITRAPTEVEQPEERLRVALLGNLWEGAGPQLEGEAAFVADELSRAVFDRQRFELISRDALPRVLEEQELRTVLGSRSISPTLRQIVPADLLAVGKVRRSGETLEIVLQAVSSESSSILGYADVAGSVKSLDDLRVLARDLALRFEQEFPRAHGTVVNAASGDRVFSTLAQADRVRPELPCVVYRYGEAIVHPETGAVLGRPTVIVAHGRLEDVQAQMSRIAIDNGGVQVEDHVVVK